MKKVTDQQIEAALNGVRTSHVRGDQMRGDQDAWCLCSRHSDAERAWDAALYEDAQRHARAQRFKHATHGQPTATAARATRRGAPNWVKKDGTPVNPEAAAKAREKLASRSMAERAAAIAKGQATRNAKPAAGECPKGIRFTEAQSVEASDAWPWTTLRYMLGKRADLLKAAERAGISHHHHQWKDKAHGFCYRVNANQYAAVMKNDGRYADFQAMKARWERAMEAKLNPRGAPRQRSKR